MGSKSVQERNEAVKLKYVEFLRLPSSESRIANGFPATKRAFGEMYGITYGTLNRWENDPDFRRLVANSALGLITADELCAIMAAQIVKAKEGNTVAAKFVYEHAGLKPGGVNSKQTVEDPATKLASYSEEQLKSLLATADAGEMESA